ncbi:MAG: type I DNA topoisomerase [Flavobacteriaceae bacterium]
MSKNLVIVESPAKAKTIEKFLGNEFKVVSSNGHIADLPSKELGINIDNNYEPKYIVNSDKKDIVKKLKKESKTAEMVWLASDEDREGEAIAWHLYELLGLNKNNTKRIVFREITKNAVLKSIENPREINESLVNAQQARRVLDRLVGYKISPVLWRKVKGGLSAGRVQSVALRLIADKEKEIESFKPVKSFKVSAQFLTVDGEIFKAKHKSKIDENIDLDTLIDSLKNAKFNVSDIKKTPLTRKPSPPFTTSTLQQEASRRLGFPVSKTMRTAQRLYEQGHITYMRTDSVTLSDVAKSAVKSKILNEFGEKYFCERSYTNKSKNAQQAHEAVRPTNFENKNVSVDLDQIKLYDLIWKRTIASQMALAKIDKTVVSIQSRTIDLPFVAEGEVINFDGFLKVYNSAKDGDSEKDVSIDLPALNVGDDLNKKAILITENYSKPPFRYTEASLVKKMEELGIGRPSTYAPTITTVMNRKYVFKGIDDSKKREILQIIVNDKIKKQKVEESYGSNKGKLVPSEVGKLVNEFLCNNFEDIIDYNFTADVENNFDLIASGKKQWKEIINEFYSPFNDKVSEVEKNAKRETGERILGSDPKSGRQVSVKLGKFGPMVQIGKVDDEEKPLFASLLPDQKISSVTIEDALRLFELPFKVGEYEGKEVISNIGRYGPYIKYENTFISIPQGLTPFTISIEKSAELILNKLKENKPLINYEGFDVTKGKGRFGPYIKWNGIFINVNKNYDFDNLSDEDCIKLITDKKAKDAEKILKVWESDKISIEKGRWGKIFIIKGKSRIPLSKDIDIDSIDLKTAKGYFKKK